MFETSTSEKKEPVGEELENFRNEIEKIFLSEINPNIETELQTGHFTDPFSRESSFNREDLQLTELELWKKFKECQKNLLPAMVCFEDLANYKIGKGVGSKASGPSLTIGGLISYISSHLSRVAYDQERGKSVSK